MAETPATKAPSTRVQTPYPAISEPYPNLASLQRTCHDLKEAVEIVTGQRGPRGASVPGSIGYVQRGLDQVSATIIARIFGTTNVFEHSGQTIADWITSVEDKADDATAHGHVKWVSDGTPPAGYDEKYDLTLVTDGSYTGLSLLAKLDNTAEIWIESRALMLSDTGGPSRVFTYDSGAGVFRFALPFEVVTGDLADYAVTTPKIDDGAVTTEKIASGAVTASATSTGTINASSITASLTTRAGAQVLVLAQVHVFNDSGETTGFAPIATRSYPIKVDGSTIATLEAVDALARATAPGSGYSFYFLPMSVSGQALASGLSAGPHSFELANPYAYDMHAALTVIELAR